MTGFVALGVSTALARDLLSISSISIRLTAVAEALVREAWVVS